MIEKTKMNKARSKTFGIVINPKIENQDIDWKSLTVDQISEKLKELDFLNKNDLTAILNTLEFNNVHENPTTVEDFEGQFELGDETGIPHYQIAIKTKSVCTKKPILEALQKGIVAHINIDVQFNFNEMKKYCSKESEFISEEYSGKIFKHHWKMNFLDRKPELKVVLDNPYPWQKFFLEQILTTAPEGRIVDWLIDPEGNTGKSSFARAYVSQEPTDGIIMKIDNLDRMELALIQKITNYRDRYSKDPKIIFFDFPRAVDLKKVISATALMEDAKSGHLETSFGGKYRELGIGNIHIVVMSNNAPDLSVLSIDRWRIWRLGGKKYNNIIWPCIPCSFLKGYDANSKMIEWTVVLNNLAHGEIASISQFKDLVFDNGWYHMEPQGGNGDVFGVSKQFTKDIVSSYYDSPNNIKKSLFNRLRADNALIEFNKK